MWESCTGSGTVSKDYRRRKSPAQIVYCIKFILVPHPARHLLQSRYLPLTRSFLKLVTPDGAGILYAPIIVVPAPTELGARGASNPMHGPGWRSRTYLQSLRSRYSRPLPLTLCRCPDLEREASSIICGLHGRMATFLCMAGAMQLKQQFCFQPVAASVPEMHQAAASSWDSLLEGLLLGGTPKSSVATKGRRPHGWEQQAEHSPNLKH